MNLPNKITLSRICLIPVFAVIFFLDRIPYNYCIAGIIFVIAACTDFIDGHIARSRGLVTNLGKFLDPIADKVLVSTALIFLLVRPETLTVLWQGDWVLVYAGVCVAVVLARELIVSGFRMVAASTGLVLAADKIGKVKTTFQDIAIAMLLFGANFFGVSAASRVFNAIGVVALGIAAVLTIWSGISYIVKNRSVFKETQA
ncbi:MAG TPA: CDP-diacylglycerol--glycerol-3-phosphate 3-phosphatidyltransferase [Candidatus Borkfalkia excrementigallinarum]|mgnify:FL=1|uniref:CDP-diacylglycerol--glycerol-3-phosphate 3-phosphatidyltransferase n=1 Tax=Candidatus Borkfalkia excrementigallinarum TaxID=2838506 RepID=A0A9D1ZW78_9FIRM|nr:CDP-diacylglycerol--glycerol-3-phosphate 3-phosphatidyltransferase [Candidatus Borkfalkia excrementigallinarum]